MGGIFGLCRFIGVVKGIPVVAVKGWDGWNDQRRSSQTIIRSEKNMPYRPSRTNGWSYRMASPSGLARTSNPSALSLRTSPPGGRGPVGPSGVPCRWRSGETMMDRSVVALPIGTILDISSLADGRPGS